MSLAPITPTISPEATNPDIISGSKSSQRADRSARLRQSQAPMMYKNGAVGNTNGPRFIAGTIITADAKIIGITLNLDKLTSQFVLREF